MYTVEERERERERERETKKQLNQIWTYDTVSVIFFFVCVCVCVFEMVNKWIDDFTCSNLYLQMEQNGLIVQLCMSCMNYITKLNLTKIRS